MTQQSELDKDLIEQIKRIVAYLFDFVVALRADAYADSLKMIADQTLVLIPEAGYFKEEADLVDRLLKRGWIPPEEAKNYVQLHPDQSLPNPNMDIHIWRDYSPDMAYCKGQGDMIRAGWRKILEVKE